ncbi:MAG: undecaprenyl-diphosphate phosphatase [Bacteroidales bacterium]|nr:undecaprenyl-diphosphate phosphatase [Bacteroidales bacterium]
MSWIEALILGLVQGLSEYLPISSSGHLEIASVLLGTQSEENLTFAVVVHAATVLSTIVVLWKEVEVLFKSLFSFKWDEQTKYILKIIISMIPVGIVGVFFKDSIESLFGSGLFVVGICLMITAALLAFAYFAQPRKKENISYWDAFIIGIAQAIAVLPGLSRSGSTIATGILLGDKKEEVAKFSFLMVIVPILGESLLDLIKGVSSTATVTTIPVLSLIVGFFAAFISGTLACKWMLKIVKNGKLVYFAIYCAVVGAFALIYSMR